MSMKLKTLLVVGLGILPPTSANLQAQPVPHHFSGITALPDKTLLSLDGSVSNMFNCHRHDLQPIHADVLSLRRRSLREPGGLDAAEQGFQPSFLGPFPPKIGRAHV